MPTSIFGQVLQGIGCPAAKRRNGSVVEVNQVFCDWKLASIALMKRFRRAGFQDRSHFVETHHSEDTLKAMNLLLPDGRLGWEISLAANSRVSLRDGKFNLSSNLWNGFRPYT